MIVVKQVKNKNKKRQMLLAERLTQIFFCPITKIKSFLLVDE